MTGKKLLSKAGMPWVMAVAAGLLAVPPLEASPFAYIPNHGDNTFSPFPWARPTLWARP
jgi:hypothetical protein